MSTKYVFAFGCPISVRIPVDRLKEISDVAEGLGLPRHKLILAALQVGFPLAAAQLGYKTATAQQTAVKE